jgi:hypothetical protein
MFAVYIKNNATGEVRRHIELNADWSAVFEYLWAEGNYGCDCNRALFFSRAADEDDVKSEDRDCGETAYSVPYVELEDGARLVVDEG